MIVFNRSSLLPHQASSTLLWNGRMEHGLFGSGNNLDSDRTVNVIVGAMGEIVINEGKDVKQVKVPILYNTIRKVSSDYLYCVSV